MSHSEVADLPDGAAPPSTVQGQPDTPMFDEDIAVDVVAPGEPLRTLPLDRGTYLIGKQADCAIRLGDPAVSRLHLELRIEDIGVRARDLGSKNGSYYRGARFNELVLGIGAVLRLGETELRLVRRESPDDGLAANNRDRFGRLLGTSRPMRKLFALLERVAAAEAPVLIEGETGTGKELCAEAIHLASGRAARPFVVCDLAGVARSLIESELFGHKRGAFTGAVADRQGVFDIARGGSLFLDELGELELALQPRLLRAAENRTVQPVGADRAHSIDVRLIAATNRDLARAAKEGSFREDLFHRLAVLRVRLPPLRERKEDIPLLVEAQLAPRGLRASRETLELLGEHDWPGNVRELHNVVERGLAITRPGQALEPSALGLEARTGGIGDDYHAAKQGLIEAWERGYVEQLLRSTGGGVTEAARRCGLGRAHLYRLVRKYGFKT